ncbi:MAG: DUF5666 domain-containing protein [Acidiferrobacteraceae bacterium]
MSAKTFLRHSLLVLTVAASGLTGGGAFAGEGGIGGTGISAFGAIQRFGSIFVNGREYPLSGARITVDGRPATRQALRLGQVVLVRATAGRPLKVTRIRVQHAVEGPITRIHGDQFVVLGQTINVAPGLVVQGDAPRTTGHPLGVGDIVRVSALRERAGVWEASRITRVHRSTQRSRLYPILLRAMLHRGRDGALAVGTLRVAWHGAGPVPVTDVGHDVLAVGVLRGGQVDITRITPDTLDLGPPGTAVQMSGYLERRAGVWRANGINVGIANRIAPTQGLADLSGRINGKGVLVVYSVRPDIPRPEILRPQPQGDHAGRPEIDHFEIERPALRIPHIERPELDR